MGIEIMPFIQAVNRPGSLREYGQQASGGDKHLFAVDGCGTAHDAGA